jgi:hypothetical protein
MPIGSEPSSPETHGRAGCSSFASALAPFTIFAELGAFEYQRQNRSEPFLPVVALAAFVGQAAIAQSNWAARRIHNGA